jgi:hypothetical protein
MGLRTGSVNNIDAQLLTSYLFVVEIWKYPQFIMGTILETQSEVNSKLVIQKGKLIYIFLNLSKL